MYLILSQSSNEITGSWNLCVVKKLYHFVIISTYYDGVPALSVYRHYTDGDIALKVYFYCVFYLASNCTVLPLAVCVVKLKRLSKQPLCVA